MVPYQKRKQKIKELNTAPKEWLGVLEVAALVGLSEVTVYRLVSQNKIPAKKIGKLWKFNKKEIENWINNEGKTK